MAEGSCRRNSSRRLPGLQACPQSRQSEEHPGLGPPHIRCSNGAVTEHTIVEEPPLVPHVGHGPAKNRFSQGITAGRQVLESHQCQNALRHTVYVNRISTVMEVARSAVFPEEPRSIKGEAV